MKQLTLSALAVLMVACSSSDNETPISGGSSSSQEPQTGVFVDAPVAGVTFTSASNPTGSLTNAAGEFSYLPGETLSFSIGGVNLGEALGDEIITPLDLVKVNEVNEAVLNMAQLLQTLDSDDNPDTITIAEESRSMLNGQSLDFSDSNFDQDLQSILNLFAPEEAVTVVDESQALTHIEQSFQNYAPTDGLGFTLEQLNDSTFYFLDNEHFESTGDQIASTSVLTFNADGTGLITGYGEEAGVAITWQRKIDGRLLISELDTSSANAKNLLIGISEIFADDIAVSWVETNSDSYVEENPAYSLLPSWVFRFKLSGISKGTGLLYTEDRHLAYSIDLREKVAESVVTDSRCASYDRSAGFDYTFSNSSIVRTGSGSINAETSECLVGAEETESFEIANLSSDFDLPFNCESFPICTYSDFNKTLSATSDDQTTTISYTHIPGSDSITYSLEYQPANFTVTEIINLLDPPVGFATLDLAGQTFYVSYANEDLADQWVIEPLSFASTGNGADLDGEPGTYEIIDGVLVLSLSSGDVEYIGLLEDLGGEHWTTCWADDLATSADCTGLSIEHMFASETEAQTFVDEQNGVEPDPEPQTGGFSDIALAGQTFYNTYADDGLSDYWVIQQISFAESGNGIDIDGTEGTYELVDGVLVVSLTDGDIENIGLLEDLGSGHLTTCWGSTVATSSDCTGLGIEHFFSTEVDAENYASEQNVGRINLLDITATSLITHSTCASYDRPAGFVYSFQDTVMTRVGSDSINTDTTACVVGASETQNITMTGLAADFDLPFNCQTYPICSADDFNKTLLGTTGSQSTTATYTYEEGTNTINYVVDYQPGNFNITEVITLDNTGQPYPFTESELQDFTWYFAVPSQADCGDSWVVEALSFNASGYSLDECGLGLGTEVDQPYQLLANGIVNLATHNDFLNRLSFNTDLQAYLVCWADSASAAVNCPDELQGYAFLNIDGATAYVDAQNSGFGRLISGSFQSVGSGDELPTTFVLNADKSGTWSYQTEGGSISWNVNDSGQLVLVFEGGGTETYTLTAGTLDSGTVDVDYSNEPDITGVSWGRVSEVSGELDYVTFDLQGHGMFVNKIGSYSFAEPGTVSGNNISTVKEYFSDGSFIANIESRTSTFEYSMGTNGVLTAISGADEVTGFVSNDSELMIVEGNIRSDTELGVTFAIQKPTSGTLSNTILSGNYNYLAFNYFGNTGSEEQYANHLGKFNFDGNGGISKSFSVINIGYNTFDETVTDPVTTSNLSGTYDLLSSGQFSINDQLEGISSDDGKVIAISNNVTEFSDLGVGIVLKEEPGLYSNALLQGTYNIVSFGAQSDDELYNDLGTLQFDGSSIVVKSAQSEIKTVNESGTSLRTENAPDNGSFSYQVTSDGVIEIGATPSGIVSGDGRIVVLADYLAGHSRAGITIAIKQP